jgi:hypothetical protein
MNKYYRLASIGFLFLLPALLAVISGLFGFSVPVILISPFLVLPGLLAGFGVSVAELVRVRLESRPTGGVPAINVRIEARPTALAIAAMSVLLASIVATYLFVENFPAKSH